MRAVLRDGETLVLPTVNRDLKVLELYEVKDLARDLEPGVWGIPEGRPGSGSAAEIGAVDFAFVPGVAFDKGGGRLGHGARFYDKLLGGASRRPFLVAGAFEVQIVEGLPVERHDVFMDLVVTERG